MTMQQKPLILTPSDRLRDVLGKLETHLGTLEHADREHAAQILPLFDSAYTAITALRPEDVNGTAEMMRFQTLSAQFRRKGATFLQKIGGAQKLQLLRQERAPDTDRWWWYVDHMLADQQKDQLRRQGRGLLIAGAVIGVLFVLYILFLAPDKATRMQYQHEQNAEQLIQSGAYVDALAEINQALTYTPGDGDLLTFKGVLEEHLGREAEAMRSFEAAQAAMASREAFLLRRAQVHLTVLQPEAALRDARAVVALNPRSAAGYFYMAQAHLNLGNFQEAEANYEKTAALAKADRDFELEAIARVQIAQMYQMILAPTAVTPEESP